MMTRMNLRFGPTKLWRRPDGGKTAPGAAPARPPSGVRVEQEARLRDLWNGRRGVALGLADRPVASGALGGIEAGVGALDESCGCVIRPQDRDTERNRHPAEVFAGRALHQ